MCVCVSLCLCVWWRRISTSRCMTGALSLRASPKSEMTMRSVGFAFDAHSRFSGWRSAVAKRKVVRQQKKKKRVMGRRKRVEGSGALKASVLQPIKQRKMKKTNQNKQNKRASCSLPATGTLRSRCTMLFACRYCMASRICSTIPAASFSVYDPCSIMWSKSSPPSSLSDSKKTSKQGNRQTDRQTDRHRHRHRHTHTHAQTEAQTHK